MADIFSPDARSRIMKGIRSRDTKPEFAVRRTCFWHQHEGCANARLPATRLDYWSGKLERTKARDREAMRLLQAVGWDLLIVWECETKNAAELSAKIRLFVARGN